MQTIDQVPGIPGRRRDRVVATAAVAVLTLAFVQFSEQPASAATATITADFGTTADYPLVKSKFGVYNLCLVPLDRYDRDINLINEVDTEHLRIDGGFGADPNCLYDPDPISGTASNIQYDWAGPDRFVSNLNDRGVGPYFSYGYNPIPLQQGGDWEC